MLPAQFFELNQNMTLLGPSLKHRFWRTVQFLTQLCDEIKNVFSKRFFGARQPTPRCQGNLDAPFWPRPAEGQPTQIENLALAGGAEQKFCSGPGVFGGGYTPELNFWGPF